MKTSGTRSFGTRAICRLSVFTIRHLQPQHNLPSSSIATKEPCELCLTLSLSSSHHATALCFCRILCSALSSMPPPPPSFSFMSMVHARDYCNMSGNSSPGTTPIPSTTASSLKTAVTVQANNTDGLMSSSPLLSTFQLKSYTTNSTSARLQASTSPTVASQPRGYFIAKKTGSFTALVSLKSLCAFFDSSLPMS